MHLVSELAGATLAGRYRLAGRVAGGTGDIYLGQDGLLERPVAVRVLRSGPSDGPDAQELWLAQASAAARLSHPHVATIFDWGCEDDGTCFMVMEHVPGVDLRDVLVTRGLLDPPSAAEIMLAVCDGLSAAHSMGIVHGALRPESILIARHGTVKLTDFGLVSPGAPGGRHDTAALTPSSRYLSPEQGAGYPATPASDIWTAGLVLTEALSGRPPTSEKVILPSKHIRKVPRALDDIVRRACAVNPDERFASISDMVFALQRSLAASRKPPRPVEGLVDEVSGGEEVPDIEAPRRPTRQDLDAQRRSRRLLLGVIAVIVALVAGRALASVVLPRDVEVPELAGLTRDAAVERAEAAGLGARVESRKKDRNAPAGVVLSQDRAGTLREGSTVGLVVSAGPPRVQVPLLLGLNLDDAQVQMDKFNMEPSRLSERYSTEPEGDIIEQVPSAGLKRAWGSDIELILSKGPAPTEIPSLDNAGAEEARTELKRAGFVPLLREAYSDDVDEGDVIEITPAPGTLTASGSEVQIVVSAGPEFPELTVPDVRGLEVGPARDELERAEFRVDVLEICDDGSKVVDTDPAGGATANRADLVTLLVC
ncbi:MAG: serine/threonine protein kinase [Actinobacteria bacterium]|nr:serine/threonine protein kinase [Actinomycetota bacterium]